MKWFLLFLGLHSLSAWRLENEEVQAYVAEQIAFTIQLDDEEANTATSFCVIESGTGDRLLDGDRTTRHFSDSGQEFNCTVFDFAPNVPIELSGQPMEAGLTSMKVAKIEKDGKVNETDLRPIRLRTFRAQWIYILDQVIGWLYFVLWSVSFYPQVIMNYRRQSVVGFNMDFLGYDLAGFISFTMYNCLIFWSPAVFSLYLSVYPGASNPIQINDVFFCLHAVFIQMINSYQCLTYERAGQGLSKLCKGILVAVTLAVLVEVIIAGTKSVESIGWFQVLTFASYIKVGSSVIKYMPQVYLNWKRKCTLGFAIDMALLDISGGTACYVQTLVQYVNANDTSIVTGNIGKIGIGFVSCFFDVILLMQHFCLYGKNNQARLLEMAEEEKEPLDQPTDPIISQRSILNREGFSPTASAVLYHVPKGDLLASTASFRDVFSSHAEIQPNQQWTDVMVSITGSRAFGERASVSNSKANIVTMERKC